MPSPLTEKLPVVFCRMMPLAPPLAEILVKLTVPPEFAKFTATPVVVGEPTVEDAISILRGLRDRYEIHHGVKF